jgi:hypothetical protein
MTPAEAATRSNAYVIYEFERRAFVVSEIPVRIGRDSSNDIVLHEAAVSRFNTEIRRENDRSVLSSPGSTPALLNGVPVAGETGLSEGAKIEIGSAVLTYTEKRLPIGVSVVERARAGGHHQEDISNRRDTIKNPLMKGAAMEPEHDPQLRMKILAAIAAVVLLIYLFSR